MVLPQRATAAQEFRLVPPEIADAAARYQRFQAIEREHLALMAKHNLLMEWTEEVRNTVIDARARVQQARAAREQFRQQVREFVLALRRAREPLNAVLRHTRSMLELLESAGAIANDGGWLEAEVLEWAIEEYEAPAA